MGSPVPDGCKILLSLALLLSTSPFSYGADSSSREVTLPASATASIQAGSSANRNLFDYWSQVQGAPERSTQSIQVKDLGDPGFWRKAYVHFSFRELAKHPSQPQIIEAQFQLTAIDSEEGQIQPDTIWEFRVSGLCHEQNAPWVESRAPAAITWNNAPGNLRNTSRETQGAAAIEAFYLKGKGLGSTGIASPRLVEFLDGCRAHNGKSVTFIITRSSPVNSRGQDYVHAFASRSAKDETLRPKLVITVAKSAPPSSRLQALARTGLREF